MIQELVGKRIREVRKEKGFSQVLRKILERFNSIVTEKSQNNRFNIFEIEGIYWKEVYMCRFVCALLKYGIKNNEQIIKTFFENFLGLEYSSFNKTTVSLEEVIENQRRVDITITHGDAWIPIEVKIYAGEQTDQCSDYLAEAEKRNNTDKVYRFGLMICNSDELMISTISS